MIDPSSAHVPPRPSGTADSVTAGPPFTETFFSSPPEKKPIHWPSGEKNASRAPSVPAQRGWLQLIERSHVEPLVVLSGSSQ